MHEDKVPPNSYSAFLKDPRIHAMRNAKQRSWIGGSVPFPGNPSFLPPEPTSDNIKTEIYNLYMTNPEKYNVRAISERYFISIKRVDAILRLKGMEAAWIKEGKVVQNAFQEGMEGLLAPPVDDEKMVNMSRRASADLVQADMLEQEENRDFARLRYQRMYWESTPEDGKEPVLPGVLEAAKKGARQRAHASRVRKAGPEFMPKVPLTSGVKETTPAFQRLSKEGRPSMVFVDVGGKFLDVDDRTTRMKEAERRKARTGQP